MKASKKKVAGKGTKEGAGKNSVEKTPDGKPAVGKPVAGRTVAGKMIDEGSTADEVVPDDGGSSSISGSRRVAIVGMSCLYPGAPDLGSFWSNIVGGVDAIREVSEREWSADEYYDPDGKSRGLSYSKRGGFISEYADFDPLKYGIMPSAVEGSDGDQFLTLKVACAAMADAGYDIFHTDRRLDRDRAEIILGRISAPGTGSMNLIQQSKTIREIESILKTVLPEKSPETIEAVIKEVQSRLVPCTPDNTPGAMPNVLAGRIASKLGFRGRNLLIDAACASSMVAVETAVSDLLERRCDFALAGGLHINSSAIFFQMFSILGALSQKDTIRPFDQEADGTILGEGIGILCLKRYEDAVESGDRIYATICAVASSSDGHGGSVLAPSLEGEALAMKRAYEMAGISPSTVQLLEAHGTGTPVGDLVELEAVAKVFGQDGTKSEPWCAIGSIKSMIGHCQSASAVAGIIKAALSLHHKILPPTLNVTKPNSKIDWANHPCYVNSQARPWIIAKGSAVPRRAAVSAFGFGGINGHMILEEFQPPQTAAPSAGEPGSITSPSLKKGPSPSLAKVASPSPAESTSPSLASGPSASTPALDTDQSSLHQFDSEVFTFEGRTKNELIESLTRVSKYLAANANLSLKDVAYSVNCRREKNSDTGIAPAVEAYRLALVVSSMEALAAKLAHSLELLAGVVQTADKDVYFTEPGTITRGKLAFLYPGLGSAYTNMLADLCMYFPEVRDVFEIVDKVAFLAGATQAPSRTIFPPPFENGMKTVPTLLASADFAVVAVLLAEYAMYQLLIHLGIKPDVVMGCSTGEFAAITTTGSVDVLAQAKTFYQLSTRVARSIPEESLANLRTLRVLASWDRVSRIEVGPIYLSADLGDDHIIVTGSTEAIATLTDRLKEARIGNHLLPVPIPYHTPLVSSIIDANHDAVRAVDIQPLATPGWSCSTGTTYPGDIEEMRASFVELFTKPILLRRTVQGMYEDGVRVFVEVGPNGILTSSIEAILKRQPHLAVPSNLASRSGLSQIHHLLAVLHTQAVPANLEYLYRRRGAKLIDFDAASPKESRPARKLAVAYAPLKIDRENLPDLVSLKQVQESGTNDLEAADTEGACDEESAGSDEQVIQSFLNTNASFYGRLNAITDQVMRSYMEGTQNESFDFEAGREFDVSQNKIEEFADFPFLKNALVSYGSDTTVVDFNLDLATHRYLLDHAIGGLVSRVHGTRVHLVPLMVTLEIMAEAALAHTRGGVPVKVEQVKAFRRIVVDQHGLTLRAHAAGDGERISVTLFDAGEPAGMIASADFVFDYDCSYDSTPEARTPVLSVAGATPPERLTGPAKLYGNTPLTMFHGPLMQSVVTVEKVGNRSIYGIADARPAQGWIEEAVAGNFLLHPLLLDNASQFVLFYLYEKALPATALLPFLIESVELFDAPRSLPPRVSVTAVLPGLSERATEANLEVVAGDQTVIRISGINSRRVMLSAQWEKFVSDPLNSYLSNQVTIKDSLAGRGVIMQAENSLLPDDDVIVDWCIDYILTRAEQVTWRDASKTKKRRIDWLLGRIAAKEAVRRLIRSTTGEVLGPHDVEIFTQVSGAPLVFLHHSDLPEVLVSISHTRGLAVALAVFAGASTPGIDAEVVREHDPTFATTFLKQHELEYLAACPSEIRNYELTRLWSAKEALYKASCGAYEMSSFALGAKPDHEVLVMTGGQPAQSKKAYVSSDSDLIIAYVV